MRDFIIYNDYTPKLEILQDKINGKEQPWRPKKMGNTKISDSYRRLGCEKYAENMKWCGWQLEFDVNPETQRKYLKSAKFCQKRLCIMCQWRKAIKVFHEVSRVMDVVERDYPDLQPIFLTLGQRNCGFGDLDGEIDSILKAFRRLNDHDLFRSQVQGWFRALEITYNPKSNTWNPHIHAILLVDKQYFRKTNKRYIDQPRWIRLWRTAMKLDYDPTARIQKVKTTKGKYKGVAEVAKYTMKDGDLIAHDEETTDRLVETLTKALYRRRLYAFGGVMKKIAKGLGAEKPDEGDLVHIDKDKIRADIAKVIEVYRWDFGLWDYIRRI